MYRKQNVYGCLFVCLLLGNVLFAQRLTELNGQTTAHLRGLSAVDDRVVWASGTGGRVGRSTDGGDTWNWMQIPGMEKIDWRDIEAFDENTAIVMGVGSPGYILRTTNKGKNWTVVYENTDQRIFLDAMFFWNDRSGIIVGDPIDGRFFMLRSFDGGKSWQELPFKNRPLAMEGEACFAASGTSIAAISQQEAVFVSGGKSSRIFLRSDAIRLPLMQGTESTGANAIASYRINSTKKANRLVVVGGDFTRDKLDSAVCSISSDGGKNWTLAEVPPRGYRSGVTWINKNRLIACGTSGVDISEDAGKNWRQISSKGYHVVVVSKKGKSVFLAGPKGNIARLNW
jgi:photosystem II stability/assembly factor-like uncharacterized protein